MGIRRVCPDCGKSFAARGDEPSCSNCGFVVRRNDSSRDTAEDAAEFLSSLLGGDAQGQRLGGGSAFVVGAVGLLCGLLAGFLGWIATRPPGLGLPPVFGVGMFAIAGLCFAIALAGMVPKSRPYTLPIIAFMVGGFILLAKFQGA